MTTAKNLTKDAMQKFVGGQVLITSDRGPDQRGEISEVAVTDGIVIASFNWFAGEINGSWVAKPRPAQGFVPRACTCKYGSGVDAGTLLINDPYRCLTIQFYPPGHSSNIRRESIKEP